MIEVYDGALNVRIRARTEAEAKTLLERYRAKKGVPSPSPWRPLHLRALNWKGGADWGWLTDFAKKNIPCGDCREHWDNILVNLPPQWDAYFAWSVAAHNCINAILGKPIETLDGATARWRAEPKDAV